MVDDFWFRNPYILFKTDKLLEFFPTNIMSYNEKLNSLSRLSIYLSIILFAYSGNYLYLFLSIVTLILTYLLYIQNDTVNEFFISQNENKVKIISPTDNNPFMNITLDDWENPNREALIKRPLVNVKDLQEDINNKFNKNLYRDLSDVFEKENSQRQFYTTPITTIPNQQGKFANWLYHTNKTCKEGNGYQCHKNNHNPPSLGSR